MDKKRIVVLFGGQSSEHLVSCMSAANVIGQIYTSRYELLLIGITEEGHWLKADSLEDVRTGAWKESTTEAIISPDATSHSVVLTEQGTSRNVPVDVVFPVLHGPYGEDGTVQGLLELAGVPIVGCGALSSALCMDKDRAHKLAALAGAGVPRGRAFSRDTSLEELEEYAQELGWHLFVKPVRAGSSFGISRVCRREELPEAVSSAFDHDR